MKKITMFFVCMVFAGTTVLLAQNSQISGVVTDAADGQALPGVSVVVKGTNTVATTDLFGRYAITAPGDAVLVFSFLGMKDREEAVGGRTEVNVALESDAVALSEVVVVGYGTQSRRTVTASIASVSGESFKNVPMPNAEAALQGRASGVSIITPNGAVGQAPIVRVRGVSSITAGTEPLYVVDGMPINSGNTAYMGNINALADINPADILSMDVLKDAAAAALYGSRAANGVVLITTRKGQEGRINVSYNGWLGITTPSKSIPVMDAAQYVEFKNLSVFNVYGTDERSLTSGYTSPHGTKAFNLWSLGGGKYVDTDWSDYIYQTGLQHSHSVSVNGGSSKVQYYASVNYTDQSGMVVNDHYDRLGTAANVTAKATDWLKLGINLNATTSETSYTDQGRKGNQYATSNFARMAMILPSSFPAYHPDTGKPYFENAGAFGYVTNTSQCGYYNPVALLDYGEYIASQVGRIISSYFAEITPLTGLTIKSQLGIDYSLITETGFFTPYTGDAFASHGEADKTNSINKATTWTNTINYSFSAGGHNFDILAGMESYERIIDRWGAYRTDILDEKFTVFQADFSNIYPYSNGIDERSLLSYLGRINYDYEARYMLSVNFRRDGFSALSKNNRWGNFGGASAAWRISEEAFFEPLSDLFSDLKVKGSWGVVGNTNITSYAAQSYYSSSYYGNNSIYYLASVADTENLKWESSTKVDVGFAAELKKNVLIEFDFYSNYSSDLILDVPVSRSKGIPSNKITTNAGAMTNRGIEFSVSATPYRTKDFSWFTSFNITTQKNEVVQLADGIDEIRGSNDYNTTRVGYSIGQLFIRPTNGIDPETGRRIFVGKDGTEVLYMFDKSPYYFRKDNGNPYLSSDIVQVISGGTMPTYYGGWLNEFKFKNFDLSLLLQYSGGNWIYNGSTATLSDMRFWNNSIDVYENAWRQPGDNAKYAKPIVNDNTSNGSASPISDWIEKGDYLRFKTLTLGYTFNTATWSKGVGVSALRLYLTAQNLFCITGYTGLDPESLISSNDQAALQGGVDKNSLPQAKVYTFGVNITF